MVTIIFKHDFSFSEEVNPTKGGEPGPQMTDREGILLSFLSQWPPPPCLSGVNVIDFRGRREETHISLEVHCRPPSSERISSLEELRAQQEC